MANRYFIFFSKNESSLVLISTIVFLAGSIFIGRVDQARLCSSGFVYVALLFFILLSLNLAFLISRLARRPREQRQDVSHLNSWMDKGALTALGQTMINLNSRFSQKLCLFIAQIDDNAEYFTTSAESELLMARVSSKLIESLRETDVVGRHEDSGFLILLPNTSKDEGYRLAGNIRVNLNQLSVGDQKVSLSIGCVETRKGETYENIITRAEIALKCAKDGGRNQTVVD